MGAGNVKAAFVHWGDLPGGPFRLLVYMALRTKDGDKHPQFWGGREDLAFGLGRRVPEERDEVSRKAREAAFKALKDAMAVLTRRGAGRVVERARAARDWRPFAWIWASTSSSRPSRSASARTTANGARKPSPVSLWTTPLWNLWTTPIWGTETLPRMGHGFPPEWGTVFLPNGARFSSEWGTETVPPRKRRMNQD